MVILAATVAVWSACQAGYWCAAGGMAARHFRKKVRLENGHRGKVVVMKPMCGEERGAFENFASFCRQDYGEYVLAFGVARAGDEAVGVVRRLQREFPGRAIELHIGEGRGLNPKVRILRNLAEKVEGEILLISDADVRAPPGYVGWMAGALVREGVGLVICPYAIREGRRVIDRLESMRLAGEFIPSAIGAHRWGAAVGFGAAMAFRRSTLEALGGFDAMAGYLLEDQRLALEMKRAGKRVEILPEVVDLCGEGNTFGASWRRELRWARGIRATGALRYLGVGLVHVLPVAVVAAFAESVWAWGVIGGLAAARMAVLAGVGRAQGVRMSAAEMALFPLRDAMSFLIWATSLAGRRVEWRGRRYYLLRGGRLSVRRPAGVVRRCGERVVRWVDQALRERQGIFEFTSDGGCLLRVCRKVAERGLKLSDGTQIHAGEEVGELHLWNEHILEMTEGASMAWSLKTSRMLVASLRELAQAAERDERLRGMEAFYGCATFAHREGQPVMGRMFRRLGFEVRAVEGNRGWTRRVHDFFENGLIWALSWTFNRPSLAGKPFRRPRCELWISCGALRRRYAASAAPVTGKSGER